LFEIRSLSSEKVKTPTKGAPNSFTP